MVKPFLEEREVNEGSTMEFQEEHPTDRGYHKDKGKAPCPNLVQIGQHVPYPIRLILLE